MVRCGASAFWSRCRPASSLTIASWRRSASLAAATAQVGWLEAALRPKFAPSDAQLAALGQARADAVKQALLADNAIDPSRVFVATAKSVTAKGDAVQMELAVK